jgi:hypothetical protein
LWHLHVFAVRFREPNLHATGGGKRYRCVATPCYFQYFLKQLNGFECVLVAVFEKWRGACATKMEYAIKVPVQSRKDFAAIAFDERRLWRNESCIAGEQSVNDRNLVAFADEAMHEVGADEAGTADGKEIGHNAAVKGRLLTVIGVVLANSRISNQPIITAPMRHR